MEAGPVGRRPAMLAGREALLRLVRRAVAERDQDRLFEMLLEEAVGLVGASAGVVFRWDEARSRLVPARAILADGGQVRLPPVPLGRDVAGRAASARRSVVVDDYPGEFGAGAPLNRIGLRSGAAVPLLYEDRLLGVLVVAVPGPGARLSSEDVESPEILAEMAAEMLVGLERAQLLAVTLTAREMAHLVINDLTLPMGTVSLLKDHPDLSPGLHELIDLALDRLEAATQRIRDLERLVRFQTKETPFEPALDLEHSMQPGRSRETPSGREPAHHVGAPRGLGTGEKDRDME